MMIGNLLVYFSKAILIALLGLSFLGYMLYFYQKNFNKSLVAGMAVSTVILTLFICGILNLLKIATFLLFFMGLGLLIYELVTTNGRVLVNYFSNNWSAFFIIIASLYAMVIFRTSMLTGYDDFSHWGTVAKLMLKENRFPTSLDTVITFQSYPLGTATFIYYFETIVGLGEHGYLLAQFELKICFVSCLFGLKNEQHNDWKGKLVIFLFSALLLIYNTPSFSLSVDNVLCCCGIFCVVSTKLASSRESYKHAAFVFMLSAGCCIVIKNSGVFFWFAGVIIYVLVSHRLKLRWEFVKYDFIFIVIPILLLLLWQRHVDYVFIDGLVSKHAMTLSHGMRVFRSKTIAEIKNEILYISSIIINPIKDRAILILIGITIHFLLSRNGRKNKQLNYYALYLLCLFFIYQCGMMIMYLFSMPHAEIVYQKGADYARYNGTFVAFFAALYFGVIYETHCDSGKEKVSMLFAFALMGAALGNRIHVQDINPHTVTSVYYKDKCEIKLEIEDQLESLDFQDGQKVLIRVKQENNEADYIYYMMRYLLLNDQFAITMNTDETEFSQAWELSDCDYCIDTITHTVLRR